VTVAKKSEKHGSCAVHVGLGGHLGCAPRLDFRGAPRNGRWSDLLRAIEYFDEVSTENNQPSFKVKKAAKSSVPE
jgi:hypothetical protein